MAHGTTYSALKSLLITRLDARTGLDGVQVRYQAPQDPTDVNSVGSREAIWFLGAEGDFDNVVFCDGGLRFDENIDITLIAQVLGTDSLDDQETVDQRCEEIAYEILAELADPDFRTAIDADTVLSAFDYLIVTPASQEWQVGRLPKSGSPYAAGVQFGVNVQSRRNYP